MKFFQVGGRFGAVLVAAALGGCVVAGGDDVNQTANVDGPEPSDDGHAALSDGATVQQAVSASCETSVIKGLSQQIIEEGNCITPGAYSLLPDEPNLTLGGAVFPYLETPARDALVKALEGHPSRSMSINSMLRNVAQQYLLYAWYQAGRCGISLAAKPGNSNHETGLAFDVNEESSWKTSLSTVGFKWFGSADPVHFDYVGSGAKNFKGLDVLAFQKLWNLNNPSDKISEDGSYGPQTEARIKKSPANGFAIGASCGGDGSGGGGAN